MFVPAPVFVPASVFVPAPVFVPASVFAPVPVFAPVSMIVLGAPGGSVGGGISGTPNGCGTGVQPTPPEYIVTVAPSKTVVTGSVIVANSG
ncbi:MAG: hypothetical protein Q9164_004313, partial [Protoblastenia rupestris]